MCGVLGALEYIEWVGETYGAEFAERYADEYTGRRLSFKLGMCCHPQLRVRAEPGAAGYPGGDAGGEGVWSHRYQTAGGTRAHLCVHI